MRGASRGERLLYGVVRAVLVGFGRLFFRIEVEGVEHVPRRGRRSSCRPIHRSNIDFLVVLVCAKRRMRYLAKDTLWKPGWGRLFTALGGIPGRTGAAPTARRCGPASR